jgi:hypothetical protein
MLSNNYLNRDIVYLRNKDIVEYDIIEGGYSVALAYGLFNERFKKYLANLPSKADRHIAIGKHMRDNKTLGKDLMLAFRSVMDDFIQANSIDTSKILYIAKDSIVTYNSTITTTDFDGIVFRSKLRAKSYLRLGNLKFFINNEEPFNVIKGINDYPEDTIIDIVFSAMHMHKDINQRIDTLKYLAEVQRTYLRKEAQLSYYAELNNSFMYRLNLDKESLLYREVMVDSIDTSNMKYLNINDNYQNYLLPLIKILSKR